VTTVSSAEHRRRDFPSIAAGSAAAPAVLIIRNGQAPKDLALPPDAFPSIKARIG
jgi:hypothetical protein